MTIDRAWLNARIAKTKTLIEAYEDALLELGNGAQSYTLDTGQTRQTVMKGDMGSMRITLASLENRLSVLCDRRDGAGLHVRMIG